MKGVNECVKWMLPRDNLDFYSCIFLSFLSLQACRGNRGDTPTMVDVTDGTSTTPYTIPSHADIMIAYSTNDGK